MNALFEQYLDQHFSVIALRILIALLLSGLIGFERELKNHSAGFRTHILVGIGACLMMLLSLYGFQSLIDAYDNIRFDPARIPSYVISGIGFLGAGTIIVYGGTIRGLTTAASIWAVAGLGLVVGMGMYSTAIYTTLLILLSLGFLNNIENKIIKKKRSKAIEIFADDDIEINALISVLEGYQVSIKRMEIVNESQNSKQIIIKYERGSDVNTVALINDISKVEAIRTVNDSE
ncbi:MgtC/SapB family protein [Lentibacillus sp. JNUCC-1]|uniref:MgtC/SapB family protein n=1 Tax=Lentibacillus sp. JNUCC-1 TaxID=2654513 RepID=UPI003FA59484